MRLRIPIADAGILTVMGGIHATLLPEEAALHADVVLAGEGRFCFRGFSRISKRDDGAAFTEREKGGCAFPLRIVSHPVTT